MNAPQSSLSATRLTLHEFGELLLPAFGKRDEFILGELLSISPAGVSRHLSQERLSPEIAAARMKELSKRYGTDLSSIYSDIFGGGSLSDFFAFEKRYRGYLTTMVLNARGFMRSFKGIDPADFVRDPRFYADTALEFGTRASGLFLAGKSKVREIVRTHRETLLSLRPHLMCYSLLIEHRDCFLATPRHARCIEHLAEMTRDAHYDLLAVLPPGSFLRDPEAFIAMAQVCKNDLGLLLTALGGRLCKLYRANETDFRVRFSYTGDTSSSHDLKRVALSWIRAGRLKEKIVRRVIERYGAAGAGLIWSLGEDTERLERRFRDLFLSMRTIARESDSDHELCEAYGALSIRRLLRYGPVISELVPHSGETLPDILNASCQALRRHPEAGEVVVQAAKELGGYFGASALHRVPRQILRADRETVMAVIQSARSMAGSVFASMPHRVVRQDPARYRALVHRYRAAMGGLQAAFGEDLFRQEERYRMAIDNIMTITGAGASDFFREVPKKLWNSPAGIRLALKYKDAAGREYASRRYDFRTTEGEAFEAIRERNRQHFGISHFYRYATRDSSDRYRLDVLEKNLAQLNPAGRSEAPILCFFVSRSDHNNAFGSGRLPLLIQYLRRDFQVYIFELSTKHQLSGFMAKVCELFGTDASGNFLRRIRHRVFFSHGGRYGMTLGYPSHRALEQFEDGIAIDEPEILGYHDRELISSGARYLEDGGTDILVSCSTANGGEGAENLATSFKASLPTRRIVASRVLMAPLWIDVNGPERIDFVTDTPLEKLVCF